MRSIEIHENLVELVVPFGSVNGSLTLKKNLWMNPQDADTRVSVRLRIVQASSSIFFLVNA